MPAFLDRFHLDKQTMAFFLAIGLLALGGVQLLLYSTPEGLGLNDDSIAYIAGARGLMNGDGYRAAWLISNEPMTHFPPGFSSTLALIGLGTGLDPVRGARLLNGLLFGFNIILAGVLGWRMTRSKPFGIISAFLFLITDSMLIIHSDALSEAYYVFFTLLAFLLLYLYFEKEQTNWLIALGSVLGLSYLVRYAALALWATMIVALFLLNGTWRKRIVSVVVLMVSALPWPIAWSIRNRMVGGSFTNRVVSWHPITQNDVQFGLRTFSEFLIPIQSWQEKVLRTPGLFEGIVIILFLVLLFWVAAIGLRRFFSPKKTALPEILSFTNGLYVLGYLSALLTTMTIFDVATRFQVRLLAPMYPSFLLLLVALTAWLWGRPQVVWKSVAVLIFVFVSGMSITGGVKTVRLLHRSGQVFTSWRWRDSQAMAYLRELPSDVIIYTDQPGATYLYVGRPTTVLPYGSGVESARQAVLDDKAVFVFFRDYEEPEGRNIYQTLTLGLSVHEFDGDEVFTAPSP